MSTLSFLLVSALALVGFKFLKAKSEQSKEKREITDQTYFEKYGHTYQPTTKYPQIPDYTMPKGQAYDPVLTPGGSITFEDLTPEMQRAVLMENSDERNPKILTEEQQEEFGRMLGITPATPVMTIDMSRGDIPLSMDLPSELPLVDPMGIEAMAMAMIDATPIIATPTPIRTVPLPKSLVMLKSLGVEP